jgi:hypothetical protein
MREVPEPPKYSQYRTFTPRFFLVCCQPGFPSPCSRLEYSRLSPQSLQTPTLIPLVPPWLGGVSCQKWTQTALTITPSLYGTADTRHGYTSVAPQVALTPPSDPSGASPDDTSADPTSHPPASPPLPASAPQTPRRRRPRD